MTKFQPNPNIHLRNVGHEYQIINGNNVVTFTGVEVCSFLHGGRENTQIMELHKIETKRLVFHSYLVRHQWERLTVLALIYTMNGIECLVKHSNVDTLLEHESLPYEVAKTLSILSNDQDCPQEGPGSVRRLSLELPRNTVWGKEMDKWEFRRSRGVVDGYTCFTGYSSKYPDGLIMTANGWISNLFNHYTKTL
jgi:hypothetical protein